ncbi:MAG: hypothetical protein ACKVG0_14780, partial [Alphaproteobacteria bacterium]
MPLLNHENWRGFDNGWGSRFWAEAVAGQDRIGRRYELEEEPIRAGTQQKDIAMFRMAGFALYLGIATLL